MTLNKRTGIIAGGAAALVAASVTMFSLMSSTDLQTRINDAPCGSVIELPAGSTTLANITLPNKGCTQDIVIQSSRAGELPEGQRVDPVTQSPLLAKLQGNVPAEPVIKTAAGASRYKFIGIEISTEKETDVVYDLVRLGGGRDTQTTVEAIPRSISFDRVYIHGHTTQDVQRGVQMNCADCEVVNSYISEVHGVGFDTQCIGTWNTTGPLRILNNYLACAGENFMSGGSDPAKGPVGNEALFVPSDIQFRRNYVFKPLSWKVGHPTYAGRHWTVKNLLELKNARNVQIDGNIFENNWTDGQAGIPILFTVRNQDGTAPWSIVTNVTYTNNTLKNAEGGINFLGSDNEKPSQRSSAVRVANSVFDQITGPLITINGFNDVTIEGIIAIQTCGSGCNTLNFYGTPSERFVFRNGVVDEKPYGLFGDGGTQGQAALDKYAPSAVVTGNVIAHPYAPWPSGNQSVESLMITSDYRTPYNGVGANIDALLAAQTGVGVSLPTPSPSATATVTVSPSPIASPAPSPSSSPVIEIPVGSVVSIISPANVRAKAELSSQELFIAQVTDQGSVTGACEKDSSSVNTYCPVTFSTRAGVSGFVAIQFLRVGGASPSPTVQPTSTPTPTPIPTPTPRPSPRPLPFCASGTRPGVPPRCRCRNGFAGNSGKCR